MFTVGHLQPELLYGESHAVPWMDRPWTGRAAPGDPAREVVAKRSVIGQKGQDTCAQLGTAPGVSHMAPRKPQTEVKLCAPWEGPGHQSLWPTDREPLEGLERGWAEVSGLQGTKGTNHSRVKPPVLKQEPLEHVKWERGVTRK